MSARPLHWPEEVLPKVPEGIPRPEDAECTVFLLGPIRVFRQGKAIVGGWRLKALELLAFLAAHPFGVAKDQVLEALWPEGDPRITQNYLWHAVSHLRSRLSENRPSQIRFIEKTDNLYRIEFQHLWVDVSAFEFATQLEDAGYRNAVLQFACALYKGDFCEGRYFDWATLVRERLQYQFIETSRKLAELLAGQQRFEAALIALDRAVAVDPYDEDLARRGMQLAARLGRQDLAVRRYRRLRRLLVADLGVEPSAATIQTFRRIAAPPSGGVEWRATQHP